MRSAFKRTFCRFSELVDISPFSVSQVIHKTFLEFDEERTKAVVIVVEMRVSNFFFISSILWIFLFLFLFFENNRKHPCLTTEPFQFKCDRPFLLFFETSNNFYIAIFCSHPKYLNHSTTNSNNTFHFHTKANFYTQKEFCYFFWNIFRLNQINKKELKIEIKEKLLCLVEIISVDYFLLFVLPFKNERNETIQNHIKKKKKNQSFEKEIFHSIVKIFLYFMICQYLFLLFFSFCCYKGVYYNIFFIVIWGIGRRFNYKNMEKIDCMHFMIGVCFWRKSFFFLDFIYFFFNISKYYFFLSFFIFQTKQRSLNLFLLYFLVFSLFFIMFVILFFVFIFLQKRKWEKKEKEWEWEKFFYLKIKIKNKKNISTLNK